MMQELSSMVSNTNESLIPQPALFYDSNICQHASFASVYTEVNSAQSYEARSITLRKTFISHIIAQASQDAIELFTETRYGNRLRILRWDNRSKLSHSYI